jgi:hypothetical protein
MLAQELSLFSNLPSLSSRSLANLRLFALRILADANVLKFLNAKLKNALSSAQLPTRNLAELALNHSFGMMLQAMVETVVVAVMVEETADLNKKCTKKLTKYNKKFV